MIYNADCMDIFKDIEDETIDCVVTDCPYHIISGGCTTDNEKSNNYSEPSGIIQKRRGGMSVDSIEFSRQGKLFEYNDIEFSEWMPELYRVLKMNTHCYVMINPRNLKELWQAAEDAGFTFQNLIVWDKGNSTPNKYYMNCYELILMLRKGGAKNINNMGTTNILRVPNITHIKVHPTEKSVELMKILVENSTKEGDIVLDPFMGSGSTGVACKETNREFIGVEIDEKYFSVAKDRIEKGEASRDQIDGQTSIFDLLAAE